MKFYRKGAPHLAIEAVKWTGTNCRQLVRFIGCEFEVHWPSMMLIFRTSDGNIRGYPGEWVIKSEGEFRTCTNESFEGSYEVMR